MALVLFRGGGWGGREQAGMAWHVQYTDNHSAQADAVIGCLTKAHVGTDDLLQASILAWG